MIPRRLAAIGLAVAILGCGREGKSPLPDIPIISQTVDADHSLHLTEDLRIDGHRDDAAFFLIRSVVLDDRANIYVLDGGTHRVQVFDSAGGLISTFGQEGQGPGDLLQPIDMWLRGDTIGIADARNRILLFGLDGTHYFTRSFVDLSPDGDRWVTAPVTGSVVGWLVSASAYFRSTQRNAHPLHRVRVFRLGEAGDLDPAGFSTEWSPPGQMDGLFFVEPPFVSRLHVAVDGLGRVHVARGDDYVIDVHEVSGAVLYRVENQVAREPITPQLLEAWKASRACRDGRPECNPRWTELALSMDVPRYRPIIGQLRAFSLGHLAVLREDLDPNPTDTVFTAQYDLFDPDGRFIGRLPTGITPRWFDGHTLLVTERDKLGVPSVVRYRVE
ncbi:MAG: 6-bladed beta-propeller [Gemmatimonadota bacterium]